MPDDDEYNGYGTSSLHHTVLQYLLHPDGHVGDILGYSLNPLHQAGWLKPAHTQNKTQTQNDELKAHQNERYLHTVVTQCKLNFKQSALDKKHTWYLKPPQAAINMSHHPFFLPRWYHHLLSHGLVALLFNYSCLLCLIVVSSFFLSYSLFPILSHACLSQLSLPPSQQMQKCQWEMQIVRHLVGA